MCDIMEMMNTDDEVLWINLGRDGEAIQPFRLKVRNLHSYGKEYHECSNGNDTR